MAPNPEVVLKIIYQGSPFNKRESSIAHIHDLYPTLFLVLVATHAEEYSIPFPDYLDRESFQHVAEDGMLIHNHDFNESVELVCFDL